MAEIRHLSHSAPFRDRNGTAETQATLGVVAPVSFVPPGNIPVCARVCAHLLFIFLRQMRQTGQVLEFGRVPLSRCCPGMGQAATLARAPLHA